MKEKKENENKYRRWKLKIKGVRWRELQPRTPLWDSEHFKYYYPFQEASRRTIPL